MVGRPTTQLPRTLLWIFLGLAATMLWTGCAPERRYKVLSFFFDGVPDPNAPVKVRNASLASADAAASTQPVRVFKTHKPYRDNQCASCHPQDWGSENVQFTYGPEKLCVQCHKTVTTQYPRMHGPVALKACDYCHEAHESPNPYLLKDTGPKLCQPCHDQSLLSAKPPEHTDGKTSCISCHFGHGGSAPLFLKTATHKPLVTTPAGAAAEGPTAPTTPPTAEIRTPEVPSTPVPTAAGAGPL